MRFIIAGWLMLASFNVLAQDRLPPGVRGPDSAMATRSVSKYLQLERVMQEAIRDHNAAEVKRLLVEDFEVHAADNTDAVAMDAWMKSEMRGKITMVGVRDMSVRELDDIAIVSFFLDRSMTLKGKSANTTSYVIDVWRQSAGLLIARYVSNPQKPVSAPTRPSGRE